VHGAPQNYLLPAAPGQRHATPRHSSHRSRTAARGCRRARA
jgi:hypothetical protein